VFNFDQNFTAAVKMNDVTFEDLYKRNYGDLRNLADNIVGEEQSHDVVQEVFLKLWNKKEELDSVENKRSYLMRSVINSSLTQLERNKRFPRLNVLRSEPTVKENTSMDEKELENAISRALELLPPKCRTIFVLSRFEEMKYAEIASYLDISVNTVENQMGIALKKMRAELGPYLTKEFMAITMSSGIMFLIRFMPFALVLYLLLV
jgi:RNA polymerase sigma-70 factor (ECF subfamily)